MFTKPSIFAQGLLLFLFGLIFLILNIIIASNIDTYCNLSISRDSSSTRLLGIMNGLCVILMIIGFIGMFSFKLKTYGSFFDLNSDSFTWFYKYLSILIALIFLVCSIYLVSILQYLNCTDDDASTLIKNLSYGILTMSILYFIVTCVLFYNLHTETNEEIIEKANTVSNIVSSSVDSDIDFRKTDIYNDQIKTLEKALQIADIDSNIKYTDNIEKLNKNIVIAKLRYTSKELYKELQGKKLEDQENIINHKVCDNSREYDEEQKLEILKELNKLNSKLQTTCKNSPPVQDKTKSPEELEQQEVARLNAQLQRIEAQNKLNQKIQEIEAQRSQQSSPSLPKQKTQHDIDLEEAHRQLQLAEINAKIREFDPKPVQQGQGSAFQVQQQNSPGQKEPSVYSSLDNSPVAQLQVRPAPPQFSPNSVSGTR